MAQQLNIPIIDIGPLSNGTHEAQLAVAQQIDAACRGHGFFYVANHGLDLARLEQTTAHFHRTISDEEKWALAIHAYNPANPRMRNGFYMAVPGKKANQSFCYLNPAFHEQHRLIEAQLPLHEVNLWPDAQRHPGLRAYYEGFFHDMQAVSATVLRGFALALGQAASFFEPHFHADDTLSAVSLIHYPHLQDYPPRKRGPDGIELSFEHHQDVSLITVLYQTPVPNLQAQVDGQYYDVPVSGEHLLVNCGTFMSHITHGYYHAPVHRVKFINAERLSIPFFVNLSYGSAITPFFPHRQDLPAANETVSYGHFWQHGAHALIVSNGQT